MTAQQKDLLHRLQHNPDTCPNCGSHELTASDYDGGGVLTLKVECEDCHTTWNEQYIRTLFFNIETNED